MTEEQVRYAIVELLFDLHARNVLDIFVLDSISRNFKVDAMKLCDDYGITYNIE